MLETTFTHDYVIERELDFGLSSNWDSERLKKVEQKLFRLGHFRSVSIEPKDGVLDSNSESLVVKVGERDTGVFGLGASIDSEDGLHISSELGQRNFSGTGDSLVFGLDAFFRNGDRLIDAGYARAVYTKPHFFETLAEMYFEAFGQFSRELISQFSSDRIGASLSFRYPLNEIFPKTKVLRLNFGYTIFDEDIFDVSEAAIIDDRDEGRTLYSTLSLNLDWDLRDNPFNPRSGFRTQLSGSYSVDSIGSDVNLYSLSFQESVFIPLSPFLVWANNIKGILVKPFGDTSVVPISHRIFLGGRQSLRGYTRHQIGPRGADSTVLGGDTAVYFNSELQYEFRDNFLFLLFF